MNKTPFIISYYANNTGTTDYLLEYLKNKNKQFYYLKHPLPEMGLGESSLMHFDGSEELIIKKYRTSHNFMIKTFFELVLNLWIGLKLRITNKISSVMGFGSINAMSVLGLKLLKSKIIFWGVDYSPVRFGSPVLDRIYHFTETAACYFSDFTIQPTGKQATERIQKHHLKSRKSIIIPNGINKIKIAPRGVEKKHPIRFIYIGSVTNHHGVLNFIKVLHEQLRIGYPLTIFGDGSDLENVRKYVADNQLMNTVTFKGSCDQDTIRNYVVTSKDRLIGVAPYINGETSHVGFGDSLKLKEYVNLGIPFITTDVVMIDDALKRFGFIYKNEKELKNIINELISDFEFSHQGRDSYLDTLDWSYLFSKNEKEILL